MMVLYERILVLVVILGVFAKGRAAPINVDTREGQRAWLEQYQYLNNQTNPQGLSTFRGNEDFASAMRMLQRFLGLPETGVVDNETKHFMRRKRCGMRDTGGVSKRKKRYVLQGSQYPPGSTLTYRINLYSRDLSTFRQDQIFRTAFDMWSTVANIKFQQVRDPQSIVDIDIAFLTGSHGDYQNFDGPGNILAHAFFPAYGGDQHYDEDENWTHGQDQGTNMLQVVTHEVGHTIGLEHSSDQSAVMFPYVSPYNPNFGLTLDDIQGIQAIYGFPLAPTLAPTPAPTSAPTPAPTPASTPAPTPAPTTPTVPPPDLLGPDDICYDGGIDAATLTRDNSTYMFRGNYVFKLGDFGVESGYPVRINNRRLGFYPVYGKIDAAHYWPHNGKTYIHQGDSVFVFSGRTFENKTSRILAMSPEAKYMDAVLYWPVNQKTYVMKGRQYWRFETVSGVVDPGYPQPMSKWGLPGGVDAAFEFSNGTFLFKGNQYYKFDDVNYQLEPGYPRKINEDWFGCQVWLP